MANRMGWRLDRDNSRLDFYYGGTRIGSVDAGGINLASGLTYDVDDSAVTASTLDAAYNGGVEIAVDGDAVLLTGTHATKDVLAITGATGSGALIDLAQSGTGADIEGTGDTWVVTKAGLGTFTNVAFTAGTVPAATVAYVANDNAGDLNINALNTKQVEIRVAGTNVITAAGAAITLAQATTISTGGLTVSDTGLTVTLGGASITGTVALIGDTTITGNLNVTGTLDWGASLTVDELILDTDGVKPAATACYVVSDNTGDLTLNAKTGKQIVLGIAGNDEVTLSGTVLALNANTLALDTDGNTYLDNATDNTIKIYVAGAQDFTIAANLFSVLAGSVLNVNDDTLFQVGTTGDLAVWHSAAGIAANTATASVYIGTPVTHAIAANSTTISNITASGDIQVAVNKGGHSQTVLFADASAGNTYINAASAGSVYVEVATATEYTFDATNFTVAASNNIKFAGNTGIVDSSGNEVIFVEAVGSAINYLNVKNAATANNIVLECLGTADKGFTFTNDQDEEILILNSAATSIENIQITSGAAAAGAQIKSVTSATNSDLRFDTSGTGNIIFMLGGVDALAMHDAAITLAAAADTAGHALYLQTEDGGADGGAGTGRAGGALEIRTGDGSASATATAVGGAGGAITIVSGLGHDGNTTGNGGVGGAIAITAGEGGDSGAGAGDGGAGGSITLTAGAGGGAGGGTAGAPGSVTIAAGVLHMAVQTIDMANAEVVLTLNPSVTAGTLMTGNILYVDPNGAGGPALKLPLEANCAGVMLVIVNTAGGAETIAVQDDAAGAIVTCTQSETAYCYCDGTTWRGTVGVA